MSTKRLSIISLLTAVNVVLCILTPVKIVSFKFTFEAFPILLAALLYGPIDGMLVGLLGSSIYQVLFSGYSITLTTPLWVIPHALSGLLVGWYAKRKNYDLSTVETIVIACISAFLVTALNTLALYADSKIYGYYSKALVFSSIPLKIAAGIILAVIYSSILPKLVKRFR